MWSNAAAQSSRIKFDNEKYISYVVSYQKTKQIYKDNFRLGKSAT